MPRRKTPDFQSLEEEYSKQTLETYLLIAFIQIYTGARF